MIGLMIAAWLDVRTKPLRTFASIAGMIAAVMAVVVVDAAAVLSRDANAEYVARTWGRSATIAINGSEAEGLSSVESADAVARLMAALTSNGVAGITKFVGFGILLVNNDEVVLERPILVSSTYPDVSFVDLLAGSFPSETARSDTPHVVISLALARQLGFSGADAVGASILYAPGYGDIPDLRSTPLRSLVIDAVATSIGTLYNSTAILVVSDLEQSDLIRSAHLEWLVHVNPADVGLVLDLTRSITAGNAGRSVFDANRIDLSDDLAPIFKQQRVTSQAVTWVALVIGGLGVFGIGLAGVRERGKEFGLRRALGASKLIVFAGVILQSLMEILLAAAVAIPLSAITVELFARKLVLSSLPLPPVTSLPVSSALRGLIAAFAVGLIAALLPAIRAARASVVQALRD